MTWWGFGPTDAGVPSDAFTWTDESCWRPCGSEGPSSRSKRTQTEPLLRELKIDGSSFGYRLIRGFNLLNYREE